MAEPREAVVRSGEISTIILRNTFAFWRGLYPLELRSRAVAIDMAYLVLFVMYIRKSTTSSQEICCLTPDSLLQSSLPRFFDLKAFESYILSHSPQRPLPTCLRPRICLRTDTCMLTSLATAVKLSSGICVVDHALHRTTTRLEWGGKVPRPCFGVRATG